MENISILLPVRPEWLVKILNGEKTIEIRKTAPKCDLSIDVYLYCCKSKKNHLFLPPEYFIFPEDETSQPYCNIKPILDIDEMLDGKVVANCRVVIEKRSTKGLQHSASDFNTFLKKCGLKQFDSESYDFFNNYVRDKKYIYEYHIYNLEIFDKPIPLSGNNFVNPKTNIAITKAPQSWCYCIYNKSGFMLF